MIGGLRAEKGGDDKVIYRVGNLDAFKRVSADIRVLARATPEDKYMLVTGLI